MKPVTRRRRMGAGFRRVLPPVTEMEPAVERGRPSHLTSEVQLPVHMTALLPTFEFHVSRNARDRYQFGEALFSVTGNVIFANLAASRQFAQQMNLMRDAARHPELAVNPGELNAMALIDEVLHVVMALY